MVRQFQETNREHLLKGRPIALVFWYRSSPGPLVPHSIAEIPRVTRDDPPEDMPGMLHIALDQQGRLAGFSAVPPQFDNSKGPWPAPDWQALFTAAGLDLARFKTAQPEWTPAVMADNRAAWTGTYPETPEVPLRIEAAAFHGRPVSFAEILAPDQPGTIASAALSREPSGLVYVILELVVLIGSFPFARYNLRLGRGDTRGAVRLGLFTLCVCLASWLIGGTHVAGTGEADLFFMAMMRSIFGAVTIALTYISFEPFVRRRWPQTIISWSRVLAGAFRDPLVGRDVLLGTVVGVVLVLIHAFGSLSYDLLGIHAVRVTTNSATLAGGRFLVGQFLYLIVDSLNKSLGILFLIFLARTVLRSQWLAAGVVVVALAAMYAPNDVNPYIGWMVNILFFALMVGTLMRFGLLAVAVALFTAVFLNQFPLNTDLSVWYSSDVAFTVLVTVAIAVFGFRTALAGQPLFKTQ